MCVCVFRFTSFIHTTGTIHTKTVFKLYASSKSDTTALTKQHSQNSSLSLSLV